MKTSSASGQDKIVTLASCLGCKGLQWSRPLESRDRHLAWHCSVLSASLPAWVSLPSLPGDFRLPPPRPVVINHPLYL